MFIVWSETQDNTVSATLKATKRSAVIAYNKIARSGATSDLKSYGWSESTSADPQVRRAVGLKAFLELGETDLTNS